MAPHKAAGLAERYSDKVIDAAQAMVDTYAGPRRDGERCDQTLARAGFDPFKEKRHAPHSTRPSGRRPHGSGILLRRRAAMSDTPRRAHREVLEQVLDLKGARVADIGCGDGDLTRAMTRLGARVTGIEPSPAQILRARAADPAGGEDYVLGGAEDLPLADRYLDVAVFFNSLHHVPVALQARALAEAGRALKPGGLLYVVEPVAAGPYFQVVRIIEDETVVRAAAYRALGAAARGPLFENDRELTYLAPIRHESFAHFRDHLIAVDESRRPAVESGEKRLRAAFEAASARRGDGYGFDQPCRLNLLRRLGRPI